MTRTGLSSRLSAHKTEPFVDINQLDAKKHKLNQGDLVEINSEMGNALVRVNISTQQQVNQLFMPIHWSQTTSSQGKVCTLIKPNTDPNSGQPEYKCSAVNIKKWQYQSEAFLLSRRPLMLDEFAYWVKQKVDSGYLYRVADLISPSQLMDKCHLLLSQKKGKNLNYSPTMQVKNQSTDMPIFKIIRFKRLMLLAITYSSKALIGYRDYLKINVIQPLNVLLFQGKLKGN